MPRKHGNTGTHQVPHATVQLNQVDTVRASQLLQQRHNQFVDAYFDATGTMPVGMVGGIKLVERVHAVVEPVDDPQCDPVRTISTRRRVERDLAQVRQPSLVPSIKLGTVIFGEVARRRIRRVRVDVVVVRDGHVAFKQLTEMDEAVAIDRIAQDEDGRRFASSATKERDGIFWTGGGV